MNSLSYLFVVVSLVVMKAYIIEGSRPKWKKFRSVGSSRTIPGESYQETKTMWKDDNEFTLEKKKDKKSDSWSQKYHSFYICVSTTNYTGLKSKSREIVFSNRWGN